VPVQEINLNPDQGASFSFPVIWISGGVGVNPAGTTPTVVIRQLPVDTPLLTFGSTATAGGSIVTYQAPIANYTLFDAASSSVISTTVYPILVTIGAADMAALAFPVSRWKLTLAFVDGSKTVIAAGEVDVNSV
jgi:hypothetical protein